MRLGTDGLGLRTGLAKTTCDWIASTPSWDSGEMLPPRSINSRLALGRCSNLRSCCFEVGSFSTIGFFIVGLPSAVTLEQTDD